MANPASIVNASTDERINGLPLLPAGSARSALLVPVFDPTTDETYQTELEAGGGVTTSNDVVGGPKLVQYLDSRLYGVPPDALTLDRLNPKTIVPGTVATVDNPSGSPLATTLPAAQYVATRISASAPGAVQVPAYIGAALGNTVAIVWAQVAMGGGITQQQLATVATTLPLTATRTVAGALVLADAGCLVPVASATDLTLTVPDNATVAFAVGTIIQVRQTGAGQLTLAGASGVVLNTFGGLKTAGQWAEVGLHKVDVDTWVVTGGTP